MPHCNRTQSSENLQSHHSRGLGTFSTPRSSSMPRPDPPTYNASIRRLGPRRPRPTAASIADVFVGSLVMASFCREHSPRGRGLSTSSVNSRDHMGQWRGKNMASNRQMSRKRLDYPGLPKEFLGVHCSRAQRMFNSSVAQRVEDNDDVGDFTKNNWWEESSLEEPGEDAISDSKHNEAPQLHLHEILPNHDSITNTPLSHSNRSGTSSAPTVSDEESTSTKKKYIYRYVGRAAPGQEKLASTSELFQTAFGDKLDWQEAVKALEKRQHFKLAYHKVMEDWEKTETAVDIQSVNAFLQALWNPAGSNQHVFKLYRDLPSPGVAYLSKRSRGALLRRFANPPDRRWVDARRYLAMVEDMIAAKLPMSRSLWSSAIHLSGRAAGKVMKRDLIRAIGVWQQMEHVGGIVSDEVVFTILFDIAIKASQFTVAERIVQEMTKRGISFRREGQVSKIYYHGMRQDPDGIRQAYDEFVDSGGIVDTVVLNCLMKAFIRAGDLGTAEQIYARMLRARSNDQNETQELPFRSNLSSEFSSYREKSKKLSQILRMSPSLKDELPNHHRALQDALPMAPDTRTFHILLAHHAYTSGNLDRFMTVIADMEEIFATPPRGMIYLLLFDGFARNGASKKKVWTADKLREAWKTYLRALYDSKVRLEEHFDLRRMSWENPFKRSPTAMQGSGQSTGTANELYTPLPFGNPGEKHQVDQGPDEKAKEEPTEEEQSTKEEESSREGEIVESDSEIEVEDLFSTQSQNPETSHDDFDVMERQIENGVFLGRRMIIILLRAFGACCGPKEVMDVWLQIERIWQPHKRRAGDVMAIKEELEAQMNRSSRLR